MGDITPVGFKLDPVHRSDRVGGGIAILHKLSLNAQLVKGGHFPSYQYMEMLLPHGSDSILLVAVYRPPYHPQKNPYTANYFLEEFSSHLEQLILSPNSLCIAGDFNFHMDLLNISQDTLSDAAKEKQREALKLSDLLSGMGLTQHVVGPTHKSGHTLDLLITRLSDSIFHSAPYVDARLSDHWSVLFRVRMSKPPPRFKQTVFRNIKDIDIDQFKKDIQDSYLCQHSPQDDLSTMVGMYNSCLSDLLDTHAPLSERDLPVRPRQPWFTNEIKEQRQLRRKYERLYNRTKSICHEDLLRNQKNKVNALCHTARCDHYSQKVQSCGSDQKAMFRLIKELFHKFSETEYPPHESLVSLVEDFADYFIGKIECIRVKLDAIDCDLPVETPCDVSLSNFTLLSSDSVKKLIMKSPSKSCSMDPIPTTLLKDCLDVLLPIITAIVNRSLSNGIFSDVYKLAFYITPIEEAWP